MDNFGNEIYNKTLRILQNKKEYLTYIRAEQAELDRQGQIRYAKEKGRIEGIENEKIEIAIKMKNKGLPIEDIAEITCLKPKFIKKL